MKRRPALQEQMWKRQRTTPAPGADATSGSSSDDDQAMLKLCEAVIRRDSKNLSKRLAAFKGDIHATSARMATPLLHLAVLVDDMNICRGLTATKGFPKFALQNGRDNTALMEAVLWHRQAMVGFLAAEMRKTEPSAFNVQNAAGETALMLAARYGKHEMVRLILEGGADPGRVDQGGRTALRKALEAWKASTVGREETDLDAIHGPLLSALALIKLKRDEKFIFAYRSPNREERLLEVDHLALDVLHSGASRQAVLEIGALCSARIKENPESHEPGLALINERWRNSRKWYPALKEDFATIDDLFSFFEKCSDEIGQNGHVRLLSLLWVLPLCFVSLRPSGWKEAEGEAIYKYKIEPTKAYTEAMPLLPVEVSERFGNSGQVIDEAFADSDFSPFHRSTEYIKPRENASSYLVKNYIRKNKPYISGVSGMMNMGCALLDALEIHPRSSTGKAFCEALSAFIVGSGMHSYPETYKSLNLHLKLIEARKMRDSMS